MSNKINQEMCNNQNNNAILTKVMSLVKIDVILKMHSRINIHKKY